MGATLLHYLLSEGFIHNWLVAGPQQFPIDKNKFATEINTKEKVASAFYASGQEISSPPVERGPLTEGNFQIGDFKGAWNYYHCNEDHLVNLSFTSRNRCYARAWAYTQMESSTNFEANFIITTNGPIDVWLNKNPVLHTTQFSDSFTNIPFTGAIKKGNNRLFVRWANIAEPDCPLAFSIKLLEQDKQVFTRIPTLIPSIERRNELEQAYETLYLDRDVYAAGNIITLCYPDTLQKDTYTDARLQTTSGRIYGQAEGIGKRGDQLKLGSPGAIPGGELQAFITPRAWEYYDSEIRITKTLNLWTVGLQRFSGTPYKRIEDRRKEALAAASARENDLFASIARITLGNWSDIDRKVIEKACNGISQDETKSDIELLGLLGILFRHKSNPELPDWLKDDIKTATLNAEFLVTGQIPGIKPDGSTDDRKIILYACQVLAGQLFRDNVFGNSQTTGSMIRAIGEESALSWMRIRGSQGFKNWNSKEVYALTFCALSYLIDLADLEEVWELASVLMDKLFFSIAVNSFKGVFGVSQGRASTTDIKSGLLDPISGITRVMWGMGVFNHHLPGTVSIACMQNYELPPIISDIAANAPDELINLERQGQPGNTVNTISFCTPDFLLSSAHNYHPGQPGNREHIWHACLGPQSNVFVNHPGCSSENDAISPNYWLGNGTLPKVAQFKENLFSIYNLSGDSILDFTHAYFPTMEFDEYQIEGRTIFGKKDDGYIALTAVNGISLVTIGHTAFRELRSPGRKNIWICQMGRSAVDGSYQAFKEEILTQDILVDDLEMRIKNFRGEIRDTIVIGWEKNLLYNDEEFIQDLSSHINNPYVTAEFPCMQMDISNGEYLLRLKYGDLAQD